MNRVIPIIGFAATMLFGVVSSALAEDKVTQIMGEAAGKRQYIEFNQIEAAPNFMPCNIKWDNRGNQSKGPVRGNCWGLSAVWLKWNKEGKSSEDFIKKLKSHNNSKTSDGGKLWNDDALPLHENQLDEKYLRAAGITLEGSTEFDSVAKMVAAMKTLWGTNRFFIQVKPQKNEPGHTMAATATRKNFEFFDPNGGVVIAKSPDDLTTFLSRYFEHNKIRNAYGNVYTLKKFKYSK